MSENKKNTMFVNIGEIAKLYNSGNISNLSNNVKKLKNSMSDMTKKAREKELNDIKNIEDKEKREQVLLAAEMRKKEIEEAKAKAEREVKIDLASSSSAPIENKVKKVDNNNSTSFVAQNKNNFNPQNRNIRPLNTSNQQTNRPYNSNGQNYNNRNNNYQNNQNGQNYNRPNNYQNGQNNSNYNRPNNYQNGQNNYNNNRPYNPNGQFNNNRPYNSNGQNNSNYNRPNNYQNNPNGQNNYNRPYNPNGQYNNNRPYNPNGQNNYNRPYNPNGQYNNNRPYNPNGQNFNNRNNGQPYNNNFRPNTPRPANTFGQRQFVRPSTSPTLENIQSSPQRNFQNKNKSTDRRDEKRVYDKRTLLRRGLIEEQNIEDRMLTRKFRIKKKVVNNVPVISNSNIAVITTNNLTIKSLSESISRPVAQIIKQCMLLDLSMNINSSIDYDTAELVAGELGIVLEKKITMSSEEKLDTLQKEIKSYSEEQAKVRPPIVTIMGHVDHGKTSLLDYIRKTKVVTGEAGGITQSIGAYSVPSGDSSITFIDTPGHEAFTAMRLRGAMITDIAVLIVAADDGIMPQTVEAIKHIKLAKVPLIVAINKMDKVNANPDRILQQLTEHEIIPEAWGGDAIICKLSAHTGEGIDNLLKMISLVADMEGLKANPDTKAIGSILESRMEKGRGATASVIVKDGTLKKGDSLISGLSSCRIKAMYNDQGKEIKEAYPSMPISIIGFNEVPVAGESFTVVEEKFIKEILAERKQNLRNEMTKSTSAMSIEELMSDIDTVEAKLQNIIIKADVNGSLEALKQSLIALNNDKAKFNILSSGVGNVSESDIILAEASNAVVIAFNTKIDSKAKTIADRQKIVIKSSKIIYEILDEMSDVLKGIIDPTYTEQVLGQAQIRLVFKLSTSGLVAGSMVLDGKIVRNEKAKIIRDGEIISSGHSISTLKIFKDDVKEAGKGHECGIKLSDVETYKEGDIIECYTLIKDQVD